MTVLYRNLRFATLIPSRGRPEILAKAFKTMDFLNHPHTYIGIQRDQVKLYTSVLKYPDFKGKLVVFDNPEGSVGIAREALRKEAIKGRFNWYVITDDNAKYTFKSRDALVQSAEAWGYHSGQMPFVCGLHPTAPHFDKNLITRKETIDGWTTYPGINFIFHAVPHAWYEKYSYPRDCFALEDRHMILAAIDAGHREFRVCMDAPYSKSRYQPGGQGDISKRQWNCGRAIERLAHDFPRMVGARGTFPLPWQFIIQLEDGMAVDRLSGGAMRKGERLAITPKRTTITVRRKRSQR